MTGKIGRPRCPDIITPAEERVLDEVRLGRTNAEIAIQLGLSVNTVKYHVSNLLAKLDLPDRQALASWNAQHRMLPRNRWSLGIQWGLSFAAAAGGLAVVGAVVAGVIATRNHSGTNLHRQLVLPLLQPGAICPVSPRNGNLLGLTSPYGSGVALVTLPGPDGELIYSSPQAYGSTVWGGQKIIWRLHADYTGAALVRGAQLDGANPVRFGDGAASELSIGNSSDPQASWPVAVRLKADGCYGFQIDTALGSQVIIFRAVQGDLAR